MVQCVKRLTEGRLGRAFYTTVGRLGSYVIEDDMRCRAGEGENALTSRYNSLPKGEMVREKA